MKRKTEFSSKKKRFSKKPSWVKNKTRINTEDVESDSALKDAAEKTIQNLQELLSSTNQSTNNSYKLDKWQQEAVNHLNNNESVIVDAPTTAGKTRVLEHFLRAHISTPTFKAVYTTPVKSLANDKLREFRKIFGNENVGITTGDIKENTNAAIIVATLETYRNSLVGVEDKLVPKLVIFDEYHYIKDTGRGSAWEESIILSPDDTQMLLLSASVANPDDFVNWIEAIHSSRKVHLVQISKRPVPLVDLIYHKEKWYNPEFVPKTFFKQNKDTRSKYSNHRQTRSNREPISIKKTVKSLISAQELKLTPAIIYVGKRQSTEALARELASEIEHLEDEQKKLIVSDLAQSNKECEYEKFMPSFLKRIITNYGIAYHHSGLAAPVRIAIENLLKKGLLRYCSSTMGLSLGINFSVRSAVIADYERPSENGFTKYDPSEVLQMLGRAGRRGHDLAGFSLWPSKAAYNNLGGAKREVCLSQIRYDPTTILGLASKGYSRSKITNFYSLSLQNYVQDNNTQKRKGTFELKALYNHLKDIKTISSNHRLTQFGEIAKFFPQSGGLVFAKYINENKFSADNMINICELAAALCCASYKKIEQNQDYELPFAGADEIHDEIIESYPLEIFPDLYDPPYRSRTYYALRDFNPAAGYLVKEWASGCSWEELIIKFTHNKYSEGDVMSLIFRTATYLQSITKLSMIIDIVDLHELRKAAAHMRSVLLRDPLTFALTV